VTIKHLDARRAECPSAPIATPAFVVCLKTFLTVDTREGLLEVHKVGAFVPSLVVTRHLMAQRMVPCGASLTRLPSVKCEVQVPGSVACGGRRDGH
jgi:hypothetical protein